MIYKGFATLMLLCYHVTCRPLSPKILKDDDKVTRCIVEVISDTLSKPSLPLSDECSKILREDETVLAMVHHQNLLRELEELTHNGESSAKQRSLKGDKKWNYPNAEWNEAENLEKRDERGEDLNGQGGSHVKKALLSKEEEDMVRYKKSKEQNKKSEELNMEEHHEDKEALTSKDGTKAVTHASKEEVVNKDKESSEGRHGESSEEDQSSSELGQEERDLLKIDELLKKIAKHELENKQGEKKHRSEGKDDGSMGNEHGLMSVEKRVQENASDEETDQFEAGQKGMKILGVGTHLQGGGGKQSLEQQEIEDKGRHHFGVDLKKRREGEIEQEWKRNRDLESSKDEDSEDEEEEGEEEEKRVKYKDDELRNLVKIEEELKEVAKKLREIRQG
ncbi:uncharacterized protein [Hemitrygon akajei]|uniref:uncharacterized protein n=1 Tax=Hemitrygon akajei TaxID=2704970 RepID=UPI003BFA20BD